MGREYPPERHEGAQEIVLMVAESARAEFLADHERVPENKGLESGLEGSERGTFQVRNGPSGDLICISE